MNGKRQLASMVLFVVLLAACFAAAGGEIHDAVRRNDLQKVKELTQKDPTLVHAKGDNDVEPLHEAARFADVEMVTYLLDHGADINSQCYNQFTPLHLAKDTAIAKLLIERGADTKASSATGTPLQNAVQDRNIPMVELLVEATGESLDFDSEVELGHTEKATEMLRERPWLAKPPSKSLHAAAHAGNLELCTLLVEHGADPNLDYGFSNVAGPYTPLTGAVTFGFDDVAHLLLDHGADPNVSGGRNHDNLFVYAIAYRDAELVSAMLAHGAHVHTVDPWGQNVTPLHVAAALGGRADIGYVLRWGQPHPSSADKRQALEKVKLLIDAGADVNATADDGSTPLLFAAAAGRGDVCELLLHSGATLDISSACLLGKVAEFDTMLQANPQLATTNELPLEQPLLHWVAANGNLAMARRLLELGADPNMEAPMLSYQDAGGFEADVYGEKGASPLHIAVAHGHHELAGLLIQHGAKFEPQTEQGLSILQAACAAGNEKVVKILLAAGAKPSIDENIEVYGAALDHVNILRLLLDTDTSSNLSGESGTTLLSMAAYPLSADAVNLLIERGAKPDMVTACILGRVDDVRRLLKEFPADVYAHRSDRPVMSPMAVAVRYGQTDVVELLVEYGPGLVSHKDGWLLHHAASHGHRNVLEFLVARGLRLDVRDAQGNTLLHSAASNVQPEVIQYLLDQGANVHIVNKDLKTPLHVVADFDDSDLLDKTGLVERAQDIVRLLVDAGCDVNAKDAHGWTALHLAAWNAHLELTAQLIDAGADVNARNERYETPLGRASMGNNFVNPERPRNEVRELLRKHGGVQ